MTHYVLDTDVLIILIDDASAQQSLVENAVDQLMLSGGVCYVAEPSLVTLWDILTRAPLAGGFGQTVAEARVLLEELLEAYPLLDPHVDYVPNWLDAATTHGFCGADVKHAQLIATMVAHGVRYLVCMECEQMPQVEGVHVICVGAVLAERAV